MTPIASLLLPIAVSGAAVFVLSFIIHMTPWHRSDYARLPDEDGVRQALRSFSLPPNDYTVPHPGTGDYMKSPEYDGKRNAGPVMWLTVVPTGPWKIGQLMGGWILFTLVVAAAVATFVGIIVAPGGDPHVIFHHVAFITFLTYAMGGVPLSIWYNRKWSTTIKTAVDSLIYALASAWIFSMMWPK